MPLWSWPNYFRYQNRQNEQLQHKEGKSSHLLSIHLQKSRKNRVILFVRCYTRARHDDTLHNSIWFNCTTSGIRWKPINAILACKMKMRQTKTKKIDGKGNEQIHMEIVTRKLWRKRKIRHAHETFVSVQKFAFSQRFCCFACDFGSKVIRVSNMCTNWLILVSFIHVLTTK